MVWGGRRLGDVLGKTLPSKQAYGESWEISDHILHHSLVAAGPWAGESLRQLMEHERRALLGTAAANHEIFPWLVKFLDANDWLSVQVHPDEVTVQQLLPSEGSKTEAWFVLAANPGSRIYAGLVPGTDETKLRAALQSGTVAKCLHHFEPQAGECIFLPAGTVHAVGGGVLMAEVQQTSDATFRLFDWNRHDAQGRKRAPFTSRKRWRRSTGKEDRLSRYALRLSPQARRRRITRSAAPALGVMSLLSPLLRAGDQSL